MKFEELIEKLKKDYSEDLIVDLIYAGAGKRYYQTRLDADGHTEITHLCKSYIFKQSHVRKQIIKKFEEEWGVVVDILYEK